MGWNLGWKIVILWKLTEKFNFTGVNGRWCHRNPIYRRELPGWAWTVCRFKKGIGVGKKEGCFWGRLTLQFILCLIAWFIYFDKSYKSKENAKVTLYNFTYFLNFAHIVNFDRNLWNLKCRGAEEYGPMRALQKKFLGGITVILF